MITSLSNPLVKQVRALQSQRKTRDDVDAFVLEGERSMHEIVKAQMQTNYVLHTEPMMQRNPELLRALSNLGAEVILTSEKVMKACSTSENPPGVIAIVKKPDWSEFLPTSSALIVDRLADPGNFGTILRTSYAAGIQGVFFTQGTVDPFNPKVVRGGMGAHLKLPILPIGLEEIQERFSGFNIWTAEASEGKPYYEIDWRDPFALVIGSETQGIDPAIQEISNGHTSIPMPGDLNSLNAGIAAGIILFETVRQRGEL